MNNGAAGFPDGSSDFENAKVINAIAAQNI
jgi:hypothetical protein